MVPLILLPPLSSCGSGLGFCSTAGEHLHFWSRLSNPAEYFFEPLTTEVQLRFVSSDLVSR